MQTDWWRALSLGLLVALAACGKREPLKPPAPSVMADVKLKAMYGRQASALQQLEGWASSGDRVAERMLAEVHAHGQGADKHRLAVEWYRRAAEHGDAEAQYQLGSAYQAGRWGLAVDEAAARRWYSAAAAQGDARAEFALGLMAKNDLGAPESYAAAVSWFQRAADHGSAEAMFQLGNAHVDGQGVARDLLKARHWYERAAEHGLPVAIQTLAMAHENGDLGYARDPKKAEALLREAAHEAQHYRGR